MSALTLCALPTAFAFASSAANWQPYRRVTPGEATHLVNATPIRLHVRDVTVKDALEEVERQTGFYIDTDKAFKTLQKKLSLNIETHSFKEATDAIFEAAGAPVILQKSGWDEEWNLSAKPEVEKSNNAPIAGIKPFQVRFKSLRAERHEITQVGADPTQQHSATLTANLRVDSDSQPSLLTEPLLAITRAEDEQGHSLRVGGTYYCNLPELSCTIDLVSPEKNARRLAHLDGNVTYVLSSRRELWQVPDVLNVKELSHDFRVSGSTIRASIKSAQKTIDGVQINITVDTIVPAKQTINMMTPNGLAMNSPVFQFINIADLIQVVDAQGHLLSRGLFAGINDGNHLKGRLQIFLPPNFVAPVQSGQPLPQRIMSPLAEPLKLIFDSPSDIVQTKVPFSFSNIPLP